MLAYRHGFHAGNHADVLKHAVLAAVLRHLTGKDKPITLVDTHAGAGGYSVEGDLALKKEEFATGIGRLWKDTDLPPMLAGYVELVRAFNEGSRLRQVPGSPAIAQMLLRDIDRLRLYELHTTDHRILEAYLGHRPNTQVMLADGFAGLAAELPPPSRRGAVLIDPPYEIKTDYARVVAALRECLRRFATGAVMVWYPVVQLVESAGLPRRLQAAAQAAPKGWLRAELRVRAAAGDGFGLMGSGMFVVNPPHLLRDELIQSMPVLAGRLAQDDSAGWQIETSAQS